MTETLPVRTRTVDGTNGLAVRAVRPDVDLDQNVWAINLLTRSPRWSYDTYNVLAYPRVLAVRGRVFFKGNRVQHLEGDPGRDRELLLIVFYPSAMHFLRMVTHPFYRLVSWFRIWGTPDLVLDFANLMDPKERLRGYRPRYRGGKKYLLHHFRCPAGTIREHLPALQNLAARHGLQLFFAGEIVAHIEGVGRGLRTLPPPVRIDHDALVVFEGSDTEALAAFYRNPEYTEWRQAYSEHLATIYNRLR